MLKYKRTGLFDFFDFALPVVPLLPLRCFRLLAEVPDWLDHFQPSADWCFRLCIINNYENFSNDGVLKSAQSAWLLIINKREKNPGWSTSSLCEG